MFVENRQRSKEEKTQKKWQTFSRDNHGLRRNIYPKNDLRFSLFIFLFISFVIMFFKEINDIYKCDTYIVESVIYSIYSFKNIVMKEIKIKINRDDLNPLRSIKLIQER